MIDCCLTSSKQYISHILNQSYENRFTNNKPCRASIYTDIGTYTRCNIISNGVGLWTEVYIATDGRMLVNILNVNMFICLYFFIVSSMY